MANVYASAADAELYDHFVAPDMTDVDPSLPTYTKTDEGGLYERIEKATQLVLPIMRAPEPVRAERGEGMTKAYSDKFDTYTLTVEIINSFFSHIEGGRDDLVAEFIARGFVSPDTTNMRGKTPLLAAVEKNNLPMISKLVSLGATVDMYGKIQDDSRAGGYHVVYAERTPLQYAAQKGKLALVKVFMEDYGANDALIAPDGALALRLAAMNGHRDIVDYLPSRRGGAWLRWKTAHDKEMRIVKRALRGIGRFVTFFVWHVPKFLLWHVPKYFLYEVPRDAGKYMWKNRKRFGGWCKKQVMEFPGRVKRAGKEIWDGIKEIPRILKKMGKGFWKFLKAIPGAIKMVALWIGRGLKAIGMEVWNVVLRFFSALHTLVMAIITWFKSITLKDIKDGFVYVLRAIFVETPKAIWHFLASFGKMMTDVLEATLGLFGKCIWYMGAGIWWLIQYIPKKIGQIFAAMGRSTKRGYQETMAYLDPKRI